MKAEKKPLYESPKVSRLDEEESVYGGVATLCEMGSNATGPCSTTGNNPDGYCQEGNGFIF